MKCPNCKKHFGGYLKQDNEPMKCPYCECVDKALNFRVKYLQSSLCIIDNVVARLRQLTARFAEESAEAEQMIITEEIMLKAIKKALKEILLIRK